MVSQVLSGNLNFTRGLKSWDGSEVSTPSQRTRRSACGALDAAVADSVAHWCGATRGILVPAAGCLTEQRASVQEVQALDGAAAEGVLAQTKSAEKKGRRYEVCKELQNWLYYMEHDLSKSATPKKLTEALQCPPGASHLVSQALFVRFLNLISVVTDSVHESV